MVRNTPEHEFWVQWSGSSAFVAKNFDVKRASALIAPIRIVLLRVSCSKGNGPKHPKHMSFGSNGVGQVRSLRKILMQLYLANLCVNGASFGQFCIDFWCSNE
jgi:hypothetical protein